MGAQSTPGLSVPTDARHRYSITPERVVHVRIGEDQEVHQTDLVAYEVNRILRWQTKKW